MFRQLDFENTYLLLNFFLYIMLNDCSGIWHQNAQRCHLGITWILDMEESRDTLFAKTYCGYSSERLHTQLLDYSNKSKPAVFRILKAERLISSCESSEIFQSVFSNFVYITFELDFSVTPNS